MKSNGTLPPLVDVKAENIEFLAVNGYFEGDFPDAKKLKETDSLFRKATAAFQELSGLVPTGDFDAVARVRATEKRCALPDMNRGFVRKGGRWVEWSVESACTRKWAVKTLTCTHQNMSFSTMSAADTHKAWWAAKLSVMEVCGLILKHVPWGGPGSANLYHMVKAIDGGSGVLAYHYLPGCGEPGTSALEGRFDTGERWTPKFFQGVCCHEDLHGFGLDHDTDPKSLMYPYANSNIVTPQSRDTSRLVDRYGRPLNPPPGPTPEPPMSLAHRMLRAEVRLDMHEILLDQILNGRR